MRSIRNIGSTLFAFRPVGAVAVAAAACLFAAAAGPAAADEGRGSWRDNDRHEDRRDHDRGGSWRGGHDRRVSYVVEYHLDCEKHVRVEDKYEARSLVRWLRSLGADAEYRSGRGRYVVDFELRGCQRQTFDSHDSARRFARRLERLGFHTEVVS